HPESAPRRSLLPLAALDQGQKSERACCEARGGGGLGALRRSKREGRRSCLHMVLPSVIALPPSIDVPRTIPIGLTNAALNSPTRREWPSTAAVVAVTRVMSVVIVAVVVGLRVIAIAEVDALRLHGSGRSNCCRPDKAQCNSSFC